jgi:hypothetical protein
MFTLNNITKTADHSAYSVSSKACPTCEDVITIQIAPEKLYAYNQGAYAQDVLSDFDADVRERFMTGTCGDCWNAMFGYEDEDESYIDYYAEASLFGWEA